MKEELKVSIGMELEYKGDVIKAIPSDSDEDCVSCRLIGYGINHCHRDELNISRCFVGNTPIKFIKK